MTGVKGVRPPWFRNLTKEEHAKGREVFSAKMAARTHCKKGHPLTPDNIMSGASSKRGCRKCFRYMQMHGPIGPDVARRVIEAAQAGKTLNEIAGYRGSAYVGDRIARPSRIRTFMKENPKIGVRLEKLFRKNRELKLIEMYQRVMIAAPAILRNDGRDAFGAIQSATRHLFEPIRGAVQSDLWTAVAEGRLRVSEIPARVQEFVRKYYRDEKHAVDSRWGNKSLDAAIGNDGFSLHDTVAHVGAWSPISVNTGRHVSTKKNWS